ncbi:hypothetical protein QZH41_003261 [Actinostola sp. cb2023]|nr:hypothetical protein QZH41_003261 [Actinostola sp. cb2023]
MANSSTKNSSLTTMSKASNVTQFSLFPEDLVTIVSIYEVVVIICCLIGYGFVVLAMVLNAKLRSNCNFFILSMGLADSLIATVVIPVNQGQLLQTLYYHSVSACEFVSDINIIAITAVALNLCAVSLERFFAIMCPFRYELFLTTRAAIGVIAGIWVYALVVGLLPQMGWNAGKVVVSDGYCNRPMDKNYLIFTTVLHFCLPAFIMVVTNVFIYRIAAKQAKRIFKIRASANQASLSSKSRSTAIEVFRINYRAAKRIAIIAGTYLACWLPQMTVLLIGIRIGYTAIPPVVFLLTLPLQYTSSAVNPCIFCLLHKEIRMTLIRAVKARVPLWRSQNSRNSRVNTRESEMREDTGAETGEFVQRSNSQATTQFIELSSVGSAN